MPTVSLRCARWRFGATLPAALLTLGALSTLSAAVPSIEAFASRPVIEDVAISPDGRYVAAIQTDGARGFAVVRERHDDSLQSPKTVLAEPEHFRITWCSFASNTRLLCGFRGMAVDVGTVYPVTRLVAVDADGRNMKVLVQDSNSAQGQFQDRILHWNPGIADTVLIEADEGLSSSWVPSGATVIGNVGTHGLPAVFELNVVSGRLRMRQRSRSPIRHWIADPRGQIRLGWGSDGATESYYARLDGDSDWRRLAKFEIFSHANVFEPIAISPERPNKAYAIGESAGKQAVWLIDLADKEDPLLVFSHPLVDVEDPVRSGDGRLLGVYYETDYPNVFYVDARSQAVVAAARKALPGLFTTVVDTTRDGTVYLLRSRSDVMPSTYSLLNTANGVLTRLGGPVGEIAAAELSPLEAIHYPARDGTEIPGYLTRPRVGARDHLPLVVLPHGGPIHRDGWHYDFLREFLASRGYAVLQMNFRGSSGYGGDWFYAAHQDWGGRTYDDVVDGARWAISQGIADPKRVAIVGWSFGGYVALLGAQRDGELFRCAVSIAGVSDLGLLLGEEARFINGYEVLQKQLGTDREKIRRDSPRLHAADVHIPVLMVHGDHDAQASFEQSRLMDGALSKAGKPHRFVPIKDADHQMSAASDRVTLLREVERFLGENLGTATAN